MIDKKNEAEISGILVSCIPTSKNSTEANLDEVCIKIGQIKRDGSKTTYTIIFHPNNDEEKAIISELEKVSKTNQINYANNKTPIRTYIKTKGEVKNMDNMLYLNAEYIQVSDSRSETNSIHFNGTIEDIIIKEKNAILKLSSFHGFSVPIVCSVRTNKDLYDTIAAGNLKKNDVVKVEGRMDNTTYNNGKIITSINCNSMQKITIKKTKKEVNTMSM